MLYKNLIILILTAATYQLTYGFDDGSASVPATQPSPLAPLKRPHSAIRQDDSISATASPAADGDLFTGDDSVLTHHGITCIHCTVHAHTHELRALAAKNAALAVKIVRLKQRQKTVQAKQKIRIKSLVTRIDALAAQLKSTTE